MLLTAVRTALKKLGKSKKDIQKFDFEKDYSDKIKGVHLTFEENKQYIITDDLTFAYQVLYWIYGDDKDKWMKHLRYKTRQELDEAGADSGEYWDEVNEEFKDELLKEFEFKVVFEGDEYEYYLMDLAVRKGDQPKKTHESIKKSVEEAIEIIDSLIIGDDETDKKLKEAANKLRDADKLLDWFV